MKHTCGRNNDVSDASTHPYGMYICTYAWYMCVLVGSWNKQTNNLYFFYFARKNILLPGNTNILCIATVVAIFTYHMHKYTHMDYICAHVHGISCVAVVVWW